MEQDVPPRTLKQTSSVALKQLNLISTSIKFKASTGKHFAPGVDSSEVCTICLRKPHTPRRLKCNHVFCDKPCLTNWLKRSSNCPNCRKAIQLPPSEVALTLVLTGANSHAAHPLHTVVSFSTDHPTSEGNDGAALPSLEAIQSDCRRHRRKRRRRKVLRDRLSNLLVAVFLVIVVAAFVALLFKIRESCMLSQSGGNSSSGEEKEQDDQLIRHFASLPSVF